MDTLAFGYILPTTGRIRDFNPLETCAARRTTSKKDTYIKVSVFNGILKISFQKFFIQKKLFYSYICDPVFILPRFKIIPNYNHLAEGIRYPFQ